ncbi:MAG TPA: histidine kinase [Rectinemataceae bacterium]|nr:histidine kinase [Rectinemataceae bacterium]
MRRNKRAVGASGDPASPEPASPEAAGISEARAARAAHLVRPFLALSFPALSFLRKLLLSLIPVVVPLLMLGFAATYIADDFINREIATMTSRQLDNLKDMVDVTMFELDALNLTFSVNTKIISTVDELLSGLPLGVDEVSFSSVLNDILSAQSNARPYVDSIYFYLDRYPERLLSVTDGIMHMDSFADSGWLKTYETFPENRLLWTETREVRRFSFEKTALPLFTVYRRLYPASHGRTGVIVMNIEKSHFDELMSRASQFEGQEVYILDRDGRLILSAGDRKEPSPLGKKLLAENRDPLAKQPYSGSSYYTYSSATTRYGWRVVSIIPAASLESFSITLRKLILLMLAIAILIGAAMTLSIARRNARRVAAVTELFRKAELGEEFPEHPPLLHDEYDYMVETLIRSFLEQRYAALQLSERQAQAKVLELKALRAQMNPHFLFNTLGSLYWMVFGTEGKPSAASSMIQDLSVLLKYSLAESEEAALSDEIDSAKRYLAIQRFRYSEKFQVIWDIGEGAGRCKVVKFTLQPLLENSIYHGIRNKEGKGIIRIAASVDEVAGALSVRVEDDGVGMDEARLAEIRASLLAQTHSAEHIGLYNTNRHIQLVFGPQYGLSIHSAPGRGTSIEVRFPLIVATRKPEPDAIPLA